MIQHTPAPLPPHDDAKPLRLLLTPPLPHRKPPKGGISAPKCPPKREA